MGKNNHGSDEMKQNVKLFFASMMITVVVVTAVLLMPFAEYNTAKYISGTPPKMTEFDFGEDAVTVGVFGQKLSVEREKVDTVQKVFNNLTPLVPNEIRISAKLFEKIGEYIGEAE